MVVRHSLVCRRAPVIACAAAAACAVTLAGSGQARASSWASPADGNWLDPARWSPAGVPTGAASIDVPGVAGPYTVTLASTASTASLNLASPDAVLHLTSAGALTVGDSLTLSAGTLRLDGALGIGGPLGTGGTFNYLGGSVAGTVAMRSGPGGVLDSPPRLVIGATAGPATFDLAGSAAVVLSNPSRAIPAGVTVTLRDLSPTQSRPYFDIGSPPPTGWPVGNDPVTNAGALAIGSGVLVSASVNTLPVTVRVPGGLTNTGSLVLTSSADPANPGVLFSNFDFTSNDPLQTILRNETVGSVVVAAGRAAATGIENRGSLVVQSGATLSTRVLRQTSGTLQIDGALILAVERPEPFPQGGTAVALSVTGGRVNGTVVLEGSPAAGSRSYLHLGPAVESGNYVVHADVTLTGDINPGVSLLVETTRPSIGNVVRGILTFATPVVNRGSLELRGRGVAAQLFAPSGGSFRNEGELTVTTATAGGFGAGFGTRFDNAAGGVLLVKAPTTFTAGPVVGNVTNAGQITVDNTTVTFAGTVANTGTIKNTASTVLFNRTFTNDGAYVSDPATQTFADVVVGPNGYFAGGPDDLFVVRGNLTLGSTVPAAWSVAQSTLAFAASGSLNTHLVRLTTPQADDIGWGTLALRPNQILHLTADTGPAVIAVDTLLLEGGLGQLAALGGDGSVTVAYQHLSYPDPSAPGSLVTTGPGSVIAIPEPAVLSLVSLGAALGTVRPRRRRVA